MTVLRSARGAGTQQPAPGRNQATANVRMNWTKELNKLAMKCCLKSEPDRRGYRKRMNSIRDT